MSQLPVVYIAGPYRAATAFKILANVRQAQEAALLVWRMGGVALCPHGNTMLFDGEADDRVWLEGDQELLRRSDAVLMVGAWLDSRGARDERELAVQLDMPIFYHHLAQDLLALRLWIDKWKTRPARA